MTTEGANTLKVRLVIPICDRVFGGFYCRDAYYHNERMNLLKKAFTTTFKREKSSSPDLVITSNNFLYFEISSGEDKLRSNLLALLKGVKPKTNSDLLIGVDSKIKNPYGGISANVFHFKFENNEWNDEFHIWECWSECRQECLIHQNRVAEINNSYFLIFSCGDVLTSKRGEPCVGDSNNMQELINLIREENNGQIIGIIDLAHMDFKIYTKYSNLRYIIATTQVSRSHLQHLRGNNFRNISSNIFVKKEKENKIIYSLIQENQGNQFNKISDQTIIALDKQSTDYEIIKNWKNPKDFEDKSKLKKVDAFFIDFEIPLNG